MNAPTSITVKPRKAEVSRKTSETSIELSLSLDGSGVADIKSGIGFLDHMLISLTKHARFDLKLHCEGDLQIDDHHTAEDCALALSVRRSIEPSVIGAESSASRMLMRRWMKRLRVW